MNNNFLNKIADVLEAVAVEKEKLATELTTMKHEKKKEEIAPLVEKLSQLYENSDQNALVSKLSSLDDETLSILSKATGTEATQLGGSVKIASVTTNSNNNHADNSFASWILS